VSAGAPRPITARDCQTDHGPDSISSPPPALRALRLLGRTTAPRRRGGPPRSLLGGLRTRRGRPPRRSMGVLLEPPARARRPRTRGGPDRILRAPRLLERAHGRWPCPGRRRLRHLPAAGSPTLRRSGAGAAHRRPVHRLPALGERRRGAGQRGGRHGSGRLEAFRRAWRWWRPSTGTGPSCDRSRVP